MQEIHKLLLSFHQADGSLLAKPRPIRIGLRVPIVRKLLKRDLSFLGVERNTIAKYWDNVWNNTPYYEAMSLCLYYYQYRDLNKAEVRMILKWVDRCECWEHSDDLSKLIAHNLEINRTWIEPTLKKWNRSRNPWKRRQSVVGLLEYSSKREVVLEFDELIGFIKPLLKDSDYYVQKGVGWSLREVFNIYPKKTTVFLKDHLDILSSIAYSSATEKLDAKKKVRFNSERKRMRKKC